MLPSKTTAMILAGITIAQVFAGHALAQQQLIPNGPDLYVESVDYGRPRIAGVPGKINITIRNGGDQDFNGAAGWQVFVGLNGKLDANCIEPGESDGATGGISAVAAPCYIRMTPGSTTGPDDTNHTSIPKGTAARYTMSWNAPDTDANRSAWIYVEILPLTGTPGQGDDNCQGPDGTTNCRNNDHLIDGVEIWKLGVRAEPLRSAPTIGSDPDKNTAWREEEIPQSEICPDAPTPVQRGCRARPGHTISAAYEVRNTGTYQDSYQAALQIDQDYYGRHGYTFDFAPRSMTLDPNETQTVLLSIFVPENETAALENATNLNFEEEKVRWVSTRAPHVHTNRGENPGCEATSTYHRYCTDPTLPTFTIAERRGFNVTIGAPDNQTWAVVNGSTSHSFYLLVNNTGNAADSFNVSLDNSSRTTTDAWNISIRDADQIVEKNRTGNYSIAVRPPTHALNGTYWFNLTVKSRGDSDPSALDPGSARCKALEIRGVASCNVRFYVHVPQDWNISGKNADARRLVPGEPTTYDLIIENNGNGHDSVTLDLQTTVFGWDVKLSDRVVPLPPFSSKPVTLSVTSPPNTPANTEGVFYVNATSGGPPELGFTERSRTSLESRMTIASGPNIRIDAPVNSSFVDAGATATYDLTIMNVGNVADAFEIPTPDRPAEWGVTVEPSTPIELQPNQQATARITLRAPSTAEVGDRATAVVHVLSRVEVREKSVNLEGRVSGPDFFVDNVLINASNPYSGDPLEVSVVVGNSGNKGSDKNITLGVYFLQNGVERQIGQKVYPPLSILGQRRLVETFAWDTSNIEGSGVLVARIDPPTDGKPIGEAREIDDSPASNERTRAINLRTLDIKLTPAAGLPARPGEKLTYGETPNVFVVEYRGNQPTEPVTIRFESEHGWLSSQSELTLALPPNTPLPVIASLDVPALPGTPRDTLTISVVPALRPEITLRASTITTILDEENPRVLRIATNPASPKLGEPVTVDAFLEDATGISAATAYVVSPTNETTPLVLAKTGDGKWSATQPWTMIGPHRVSVEAVDAADPPNRNRTRDVTATFTISPGSLPTIKLGANQSTTVRTGTPIRLDVQDALGIGKVTYTIKGVTYEARGPGYQIDTSTFPAGPVDITVTAENIYGVTSTQKFSFTVDNTPPGINRVAMQPERPRANEDVTLTIATEAKVEAVDVLIKRDGQVIQTVNATKKGIGSFTVTFNPGEGDYQVDVTARDAAGNTKLAQSAVVFSAKPGSPIPGAGLALVLVLVAAIAIALQRRK